jgi:hypothetical protein
MTTTDPLAKLRLAINESLRVQRGGAESIPYIDVNNALTDVMARQNHTIFARRGCGKTLLLHYSCTQLPPEIKTVYLNCEDFKNHTFPNVLIEILDAVFGELEKHLGGWFGRKKKSRELISQIRRQLTGLRARADAQEEQVREARVVERAETVGAGAAVPQANFAAKHSESAKHELERTYKRSDDKLRELNTWLPRLKEQIRTFFELSTGVKAVFIQIDDFYHLRRVDQPFVVDYVHRLCKDVPLYFKIATLRHASVLYADRGGQPTGAQERHDYQPINIDFTFADFRRTEIQVRRIFYEFGRKAKLNESEVDGLFKGDGFRRLVMAGGGVPRDCLSLFLEVLDRVHQEGDGRIGKDDVRIHSRSNFERRIQELKADSEGKEQDELLTGIYVVRQFCLDRKINVFFVSEQELQTEDRFRDLLYRLLDYRIIHSAGTALTHKSQPGTFHAFVIDVGCYAHMRTLEGRFTEIDIAHPDARENMRSAPVLSLSHFKGLWEAAPTATAPEAALAAQETAA